MPLGPIELLVVKFPGNKFRGEIVPALAELVDNGTIRIVDFVFIIKYEDGVVEEVEYSALASDLALVLGEDAEQLEGLLSAEDVVEFAALLEPNSSAALMLFENVWATRFQNAVLNANGQLVLSERIPRRVIEEILSLAE